MPEMQPDHAAAIITARYISTAGNATIDERQNLARAYLDLQRQLAAAQARIAELENDLDVARDR